VAAAVHHRFAMVALAVQERPLMRASDVELLSPGPSYTVATLERLADAGYEPSQLFFIIGTDAFAEIATWREYPRFLDAANFAVVSRGGHGPADVVLETPALGARVQRILAGQEARFADAEEGTRIFVIEHATPDVSSTLIRSRCASGESVSGMVAPAVERHIARHGLYAGGHVPGPTPVNRTPHGQPVS
jgi:nicotinate-nucleotide adenylyltransferase